MLIFQLVNPWLVAVFLVITVAAAIVHKISGNHQKVTLTFVGIVGASLWFWNEPFAEPIPGAIKATLITATILQALFAGIAYWVRDTKTSA
ncbi:hypothetical protein [Pseudomonas sp.]|uniref:hypothetical protein n=1 Tax=Pseudomonas sp. TaxID=306 RepID=UPI0029133E5E|nr:hypothetical protein [Pseudomonas sp.]MDU4254562.1 hypothetical protein [Pseudomonas sp.]